MAQALSLHHLRPPPGNGRRPCCFNQGMTGRGVPSIAVASGSTGAVARSGIDTCWR
ncbi:hypothetical protein BOSEA1005_11926 [Hyphomicrobiales bacterium]|nr:hypothetical protein BOSEA1005_11926 [Hyphomicrobiales bacterium]CAI0342517.1 hypothetical protein BO1005MUT1_190030 [Hyphomicrobiales bacterium]